MSTNDPPSDGAVTAPDSLSIRVRRDLPGSVTLLVTGDLDAAGAAVLDEALRAASDADHRQVTVDLCAAAFVGVRAMRVLLEMHARSRSGGRALRILVGTDRSSRLLAGVGLGPVLQERAPARPVTAPFPAPAASGTASAGGDPDRSHLRLVRSAPAGAPPAEPTSTWEAALSCLRWTAAWTDCSDVSAAARAVAEEAVRFLGEVEHAEVEVLDETDVPGWWASADRDGAARPATAARPSDAVAALTPGVRGTVLTLRLGGAGVPAVGTLMVASGSRVAFGHDTWEGAHFFAAAAAGLLASTRRRHHAAVAVRRRDTVAQAQGMLMERYAVSPARALTALTHVSSTRGLPVGEVAESFLCTGEL